jgi:hypothetical protein
MLVAEEVTSIFVAVTEPGQPPEQYGLLPMADLILEFRYQTFFKEWHKWLLTHVPAEDRLPEVVPTASAHRVSTVVMQVRRMPGGHTAGKRSILELIEVQDDLDRPPGLYLTEMPPWFPAS